MCGQNSQGLVLIPGITMAIELNCTKLGQYNQFNSLVSLFHAISNSFYVELDYTMFNNYVCFHTILYQSKYETIQYLCVICFYFIFKFSILCILLCALENKILKSQNLNLDAKNNWASLGFINSQTISN